MKKTSMIIIWVLVFILVIASAGIAYYVDALKSVRIKDIEVISISDISEDGFMIEGRIIAHNPSALMGIQVYDSDIRLVKKDNNALLATGMINGGFLEPKSDADLSFSGYMKFSNTLDLAVDVIGKDQTIIVAEGDILISKTLGISAPFRLEFDINRDIKGYAVKKLDEWLGFFIS